jgi:hypothetical protein
MIRGFGESAELGHIEQCAAGSVGGRERSL